MKTKKYILLVILIAFTSCNQPSTKDEAADSTQLPTDTVVSKMLNPVETVPVNEPVEPDEPPIDSVGLASPEFSFYAQTISSDKRETKLVNKLAQLVEQFAKEKFVTTKMSYVHDDAVGYGKERHNEVWYYNVNG
jgi:PBP1b-binding outer membrane lipoprotein LpoB